MPKTGNANPKAKPTGMELELIQNLIEREIELYEFPATVLDVLGTVSDLLQEVTVEEFPS